DHRRKGGRRQAFVRRHRRLQRRYEDHAQRHHQRRRDPVELESGRRRLSGGLNDSQTSQIGSLGRHSYRSASIGSTFAARRVGAQQANSATLPNNNPTTIKVAGSVGSTSNRKDFRTRDNTRAAAMPEITPPA